LVEQLTVKFD